jgi:hypothetical protein
MTSTRLRQYADRMERVCSNYQELTGSGYKACRTCQDLAEELRIFAAKFDKGEKPKPGPTPIEIMDHQPRNPQPEPPAA